MKAGWNLGNTLDAMPGETSWGQPYTIREMIDALRGLGFGLIRIPVSWGGHTSGAPDYRIEPEWLDRAETVVGWALDAGLRVIINSHHDNDYYYPSPENAENAVSFMRSIWTQLAKRFSDYDARLIFESMNEPRLAGTAQEWVFDENNPDCKEASRVIALCNQTCVDAVREAGGRNFARMIMVPPYAASPSAAMSNTFSLPEDPSGRVLLSVHAYTPYQLCMLGTKKYSEFNDDCRTEISGLMSGLFSRFIKKGVPVIIGETGCTNKGNPEERRKWAEYFFSKACRRGITCVIWDNGEVGVGEENFGLYDRVSHKIFPESESYYEGMISGLSK